MGSVSEKGAPEAQIINGFTREPVTRLLQVPENFLVFGSP